MPLTVREALQLETLRECRLLTGEVGLERAIRGVTVLEILDELVHLAEGEFLITTAFDLQRQGQEELVRLLAGKRIAALAIQTGFYLREVPQTLVDLAVSIGLVIVELPTGLKFSDVIRSLMEEILKGEKRTGSYRAKALEMQAALQLILSETPSEEALEKLSFWKLPPGENYGVLLAEAVPENGPDLAVEEALRLLDRENRPSLVGRDPRGRLIVLFPASGSAPQVEVTARRILQILGAGGKPESWKAGLGGPASLPESRRTLEEAGKALQALQRGLAGDGSLACYSALGYRRLFLEVEDSILQACYRETVEPLARSDRSGRSSLLKTLRVYLKYWNINQAAAELFIHRHTMKYRLGKIEELTGFSLQDPEDAFRLKLGLELHDYLQARHRPTRQAR